jgi:hypothetical protein
LQGNPSLRSYARLDLNPKKRALILAVVSRGVQAAPEAVATFLQKHPGDAVMNQKHNQLEISVTHESWLRLKSDISTLVASIVAGWKEKVKLEANAGAPTIESTSVSEPSSVPSATCP